MCGITGFIDLKSQLTSEDALSCLLQMTHSLHHRGPNDHGTWIDPAAKLALGQTRLSILDLTEHGHQPMHSNCGRYVLVYNGEIFNHLQIRKELNTSFTGHSDTETLIEALAKWGIEKTLPKLNGMFAFALWDKHNQELTLVRDRLGIKPLYWGLNENTFYFGSELKPLKHLPLLPRKINQEALYEYLHYAYVPTPLSIFQNVHKLRPGYILKYRPGQEPVEICYWSIAEKAQKGLSDLIPVNQTTEAIHQLEEFIKDAVSLRLISDVPIGAFLSGSVDSSTVAAIMQEISNTKIKTFSIGFEDKGYDESRYSKQVAKYLNTDHTELIVNPQQVLDVIPLLPHIYDEPFADSSQIPTYLVSKLARESVTVALSGDGGDENFAGYNRHRFSQSSTYKFMNKIPYGWRKIMANILSLPSPSHWDKLAHFIPASKRPRQLGDKIAKFAGLMDYKTREDIYDSLISCIQQPEDLLNNPYPSSSLKPQSQFDNFLNLMQLLDTTGYLPDDILTKVDRASMATSLEARVPLLDYRIVEFSWRLPTELKLRNGTSKWILREILYKRVPKKLIDRPKMGFALPIDQWLRGPLKDWSYSLLERNTVNTYFNPFQVKQMLEDHHSGRRNYQHQLWTLAMFQQWYEKDM